MHRNRQPETAKTFQVGGVAAPAFIQAKKAGKELKGAVSPVGLACP